MARSSLFTTVIDSAGNAKAGVLVEVRRRSDNALATIYSAETGTGVLSNPLTTDALGRIIGAWLDRGAYRLTVSGGAPAIVTYQENFDAAPGSDGAVDQAWASPNFLPIGAILGYGGAGDPAGGVWMLCDGRTMSRTAFPSLFAAIGTAYGFLDVNSFYLPDFRGRLLMGAGAGVGHGASGTGKPAGGTALSGRALGDWGGLEVVRLTGAQSGTNGNGSTTSSGATRSSGAKVPGQAGGIAFANLQNVRAGFNYVTSANPPYSSSDGATAYDHEHDNPVHSHPLTDRGADQDHSNTPPFTVANRIIRVA